MEMYAGVKLQIGGNMVGISDLLGLLLLCSLCYFILCRLFDVDKLTSDQLDRYNKELEYQRWVLECNAVPSNHNYEHMAEQAVMEGKTQEDNPFPYGTRDYDRWFCSYWDAVHKKAQQTGTTTHTQETINILKASPFEVLKMQILGKKTIEPDTVNGAVEISEYNGKRYFVRVVERREV